MVNVASKWGFTAKNYKQLVQMHAEFKDKGVEIVAFPCNQFANQESGTAEDIVAVARGKYGAEFPIMEKSQVNGKNTNEVFRFLRANSSLYDAKKKVTKEIPWNFCKFLVSGDGKRVRYYNPRIDPVKMIPDIEKFLGKVADQAEGEPRFSDMKVSDPKSGNENFQWEENARIKKQNYTSQNMTLHK